jgi:drug/metabolite transporter (DMT)-like permease
MWLAFILLSTIAWAGVNVLNSVLIHHYHKSPFILAWIQSAMGIPVLLVIVPFIEIKTPWALFLFITGITAYLADLWFFYAAEKIDISVLNIAWSVLSLLLAVVGVFYFEESWSIQQSVGSCLILAGTLLLTFFHQHISLRKTLWLLVVLALLYLPFYSIKKSAISDEVNVGTVFFWLTVGRETPSFLLPLFSKKTLKTAFQIIHGNLLFPLKSLVIIFCYFMAEFFGALAYKHGPLSLVSITSNTQPFIVILGAWFCASFWPRLAPKELFSRQSLKIKILSFSLVFAGLILMPPQ